MKKIAVFSDVHANLQVLNCILEDINKDNFDEVFCLGDIVGGGPNPKECVEILRNSNIKLCLGNHDLYQVKGTDIDDELSNAVIEHEKWINSVLDEDDMNYLCNQKLSYDLLIDGKLFTFAHFLFEEDHSLPYPFLPLAKVCDNSIVDNLIESNYDYYFFGHCHDTFDVYSDKRFFSCVGSSGCVKGNTTFYTIIEVDNGIVKISKKYLIFDRKTFEKGVKNVDYPSKEDCVKHFFGIEL